MKKKENGLSGPSCKCKKLLLTMKISAFLLFVGIIELIADPGYSQNTRITIDLKNTTIEDVLNKIEDVSEFYFLFNQKLIDVDKRVDIMAQNEPIKDILGKIFPENVKYVVSNRQIVLTPADEQYALASIMQQGSVTGIIKDASTGEPMPGVNISIKGTNTGTITDAEGRFSIEIANRDVTIVISFIGYATQEVSLDGRSNLDIAMVSEMMDLEEIVVTAYGTTKRSAIAGSVAVVNNRTIEINKSTNITSTLQGLIPGVQVVATSGQPGAVQDILIRGIGSMAASSSPLYIVDGVPFDLSLNSIPTSDIQSISVLKDASASSLYGAHAANGVVLITTKKGSSDKPKIDFFTILSTSELAVPYP
ncbi:SusC/RagA family TonB-linked outer membrane protein, partial [bacterium]|nr:SusC/RagA family TonB-linked outer membrane protein [bacterium]